MPARQGYHHFIDGKVALLVLICEHPGSTITELRARYQQITGGRMSISDPAAIAATHYLRYKGLIVWSQGRTALKNRLVRRWSPTPAGITLAQSYIDSLSRFLHAMPIFVSEPPHCDNWKMGDL